MSKRSLLATVSMAFLLHFASPASAGWLGVSATCTDEANFTLRWTWYESDPPANVPPWVGYDVLRRSLTDCGPFVRVNDTPFPRTVGATHTNTFVEAAPSEETTFQYQVIYVDANRQPLSFGFPDREPGYYEVAWVSCPNLSAPVTEGTLNDLGWALEVVPCPRTCYESFYFDDPDMVAELRPLAGTGRSVRLFGQPYCGTVEGCGIDVASYEVSDCITTPIRSATWGQLKLLYR